MRNAIAMFILVILLNQNYIIYGKRIKELMNDEDEKHVTESWSTHVDTSTNKFDRRPVYKKQKETPVRAGESIINKFNKDALTGKQNEKKKKKEETNFDLINQKIINSSVKSDIQDKKTYTYNNQFRNDDVLQTQKHFRDDLEDFIQTNRHKKMKKQNGGYYHLPFAKERKPNIILILTDDQDVELGSLNFMPRTLSLLRDEGAEFRHAYVTTPMCCPSRSSLLTGMYVHNHHVFTNNENCSNIAWQQTHETNTFATYLSNAGYRTGFFGKYLNKYNGSYIPPGWREWGGLIMNSRYYNYSINMNGKKIKHGNDYAKDYYPDLIANDSIAFLRQSKKYFSRKPVMLVLSFPTPHGPEDSAPQFSNMFFNITTHHTPTYDYAPNPDKQWILQVTNKMQNIHKQFTDLLMTKRLQTLQSVDVAVERIYNELRDIGELDNTYIFYTSDHGYHLGQFGLVKGKSFPFEFDVRVPFLVRGPGVEPGTIVDDIVLNIDLAPTFLDIGGVEVPPQIDGRSVLSLLHHRPNKRRKLKWPDTFLIESSGRRETHEDIIKKQEKNKSKLKKKDEEEIAITTTIASEVSIDDLNITKEDWQPSTTDSALVSDSDELDDDDDDFTDAEDDDGIEEDTTSRDTQDDNKILPILQPFNPVIPKLTRLAIECQRSDLQSPCRPGQKWHCVTDGDRWRKHKCKFQRKCICTTTSGFVYTKLENEDRRSYKQMRNEFTRRPLKASVQSLHSKLSLLMRSKRNKRDTTENVAELIKDVKLELFEAQELNSSINATSPDLSVSRCFVTQTGSVNCSHAVYEDAAVWREHRHAVEKRIKELKKELELLKEIRKHLRTRRPSGVETIELDEDELEQFSTSPKYLSTSTEYPTEELDYNSTTYSNSSEADSTTQEDKEMILQTTISTIQKLTTRRQDERQINRIDGSLIETNRGRDKCICGPEGSLNLNRRGEKEAKRRIKEQRLKKKERKLRKKSKMEKECLSEKMNCFSHDNDHWRTQPLWTEGPFCFCMNANNNTYTCLRTINATHNYLYCEFTTGLRTFYNLRIDPFEQWNRIKSLTPDELSYLSNQLQTLRNCQGTKQCTVGAGGREKDLTENHGTKTHHHQYHHHHDIKNINFQ